MKKILRFKNVIKIFGCVQGILDVFIYLLFREYEAVLIESFLHDLLID